MHHHESQLNRIGHQLLEYEKSTTMVVMDIIFISYNSSINSSAQSNIKYSHQISYVAYIYNQQFHHMFVYTETHIVMLGKYQTY